MSWNKAVGDEIAAGDILAEVETDKAVMEFEAAEVRVIFFLALLCVADTLYPLILYCGAGRFHGQALD